MPDYQSMRTFKRIKETKNTFRYEEEVPEDDAPIIGTLYVQKFWCKGAETLTVTIAIKQ